MFALCNALGYDKHMTSGLTYERKTKSVEATKQLAATLAPYLHAGDVIVLSGDLGAGKTQFVQGVARALGITTSVPSPTFNILLSYKGGRLPVYHLDLYRLESSAELEDIDYYALIDGRSDGVVFVEWGEKFPRELPCDYLQIAITADETGQRTVRVHSNGMDSRQVLFVWASDTKSYLAKKSGNPSTKGGHTTNGFNEGIRL